jgi:hypothetical protein
MARLQDEFGLGKRSFRLSARNLALSKAFQGVGRPANRLQVDSLGPTRIGPFPAGPKPGAPQGAKKGVGSDCNPQAAPRPRRGRSPRIRETLRDWDACGWVGAVAERIFRPCGAQPNCSALRSLQQVHQTDLRDPRLRCFALREAIHAFRDSGLSPACRPAKRPATVRSSSRSGQWMYVPSPKISK